MNDYLVPQWQTILEANQLGTFDQLWHTEAGWVEPLNNRRGGWSGVSRLNLRDANGNTVTLYLKRQQNHIYKPYTNLIKGAPTFRREILSMKRFMRKQIPIAEPIYYAERRINNHIRAILITASISPEYRSLEELYKEWQEQGFPCFKDRREILQKVAMAVRSVHNKHIRHGAMVAKHIFIKYKPNEPVEIKFIDLEKARYWFLPKGGAGNDLNALRRCFMELRLIEKLLFYKYYMGIDKLKKNNIHLLNELTRREKRSEKKARKAKK